MIPNDAPIYSIVTGIDWPIPLEVAEHAHALIDGAFRAAPEEKIAAEVYQLRLLTRGREQRHESDREAEALIWVEKLRGYPGDIVVDVLQSWPSRSNGQWWPTWSEVEKELRARTGERQALANHVQAVIRSGGRPEPVAAVEKGPEWRPTMAELKELFGENWGIASQNVESTADAAVKGMTPDERKAHFASEADRQAAAFRANPPRLSPSLLSKLQSSGHIQQTTEAA